MSPTSLDLLVMRDAKKAYDEKVRRSWLLKWFFESVGLKALSPMEKQPDGSYAAVDVLKGYGSDLTVKQSATIDPETHEINCTLTLEHYRCETDKEPAESFLPIDIRYEMVQRRRQVNASGRTHDWQTGFFRFGEADTYQPVVNVDINRQILDGKDTLQLVFLLSECVEHQAYKYSPARLSVGLDTYEDFYQEFCLKNGWPICDHPLPVGHLRKVAKASQGYRW